MKNVKAVLIDIDNTLLDFHKSAKASMKKSFERLGLEFKDCYFDTFTVVNDSLWLEIEKGNLTRQQLFKIRFNTVFKSLDISCDGTVCEDYFRENLKDFAFPIDGAIEILEYLTKKYRLYAASNANVYAEQINRLKLANMLGYFKDVFISQQIGYQKPDREFFNACLERMDVLNKEEIVMIGDSLTADIQGGKNFGIKTVWFNFNNKSNDGVIIPDYTVHALSEIKNLL